MMADSDMVKQKSPSQGLGLPTTVRTVGVCKMGKYVVSVRQMRSDHIRLTSFYPGVVGPFQNCDPKYAVPEAN